MYATPAYTAVAARQTLQRPSPADPPPPPRKIDWSPEVRAYVQRAFDAVNEVRGIDGKAMQEKLKVIISKAADDNLLEQIDWSTYPLPQHIIKQEREQAALHSAQASAIGNNYASAASRISPLDGSFSPVVNYGKKRKSPDVDVNVENQEALFPSKRKGTKSGLEDRITGRTKSQDKKQKKVDVFRQSVGEKDSDAFEKRRQRFGHVTPDSSPYVSSRGDTPEVLTGPLVGTCQKLEKNYFRLTAPPAPNTVRPLPVLEQALDLIRKKWKKEHNYTYACDQLKSLRQDLTVQHIKNEFTVKVYEVHARIALEMADLGEYNQCQTQLRVLYKLNLGGKPEEFTAYRILYFIYTCNRTDMNDVLADLTTADKQKPGVQHALQVRSALASGNYHKFFRLYDEAPFMGPYLLDMFVRRERLAALAAICKAYKPDISLRFLADELAFHGEDESDQADPDAGPRQCLQFICENGGEHLVERKDDDVRLMTAKAGSLFESARAAAFGKVDIKGQI